MAKTGVINISDKFSSVRKKKRPFSRVEIMKISRGANGDWTPLFRRTRNPFSLSPLRATTYIKKAVVESKCGWSMVRRYQEQKANGLSWCGEITIWSGCGNDWKLVSSPSRADRVYEVWQRWTCLCHLSSLSNNRCEAKKRLIRTDAAWRPINKNKRIIAMDNITR